MTSISPVALSNKIGLSTKTHAQRTKLDVEFLPYAKSRKLWVYCLNSTQASKAGLCLFRTRNTNQLHESLSLIIGQYAKYFCFAVYILDKEVRCNCIVAYLLGLDSQPTLMICSHSHTILLQESFPVCFLDLLCKFLDQLQRQPTVKD